MSHKEGPGQGQSNVNNRNQYPLYPPMYYHPLQQFNSLPVLQFPQTMPPQRPPIIPKSTSAPSQTTEETTVNSSQTATTEHNDNSTQTPTGPSEIERPIAKQRKIQRNKFHRNKMHKHKQHKSKNKKKANIPRMQPKAKTVDLSRYNNHRGELESLLRWIGGDTSQIKHHCSQNPANEEWDCVCSLPLPLKTKDSMKALRIKAKHSKKKEAIKLASKLMLEEILKHPLPINVDVINENGKIRSIKAHRYSEVNVTPVGDKHDNDEDDEDEQNDNNNRIYRNLSPPRHRKRKKERIDRGNQHQRARRPRNPQPEFDEYSAMSHPPAPSFYDPYYSLPPPFSPYNPYCAPFHYPPPNYQYYPHPQQCPTHYHRNHPHPHPHQPHSSRSQVAPHKKQREPSKQTRTGSESDNDMNELESVTVFGDDDCKTDILVDQLIEENEEEKREKDENENEQDDDDDNAIQIIDESKEEKESISKPLKKELEGGLSAFRKPQRLLVLVPSKIEYKTIENLLQPQKIRTFTFSKKLNIFGLVCPSYTHVPDANEQESMPGEKEKNRLYIVESGTNLINVSLAIATVVQTVDIDAILLLGSAFSLKPKSLKCGHLILPTFVIQHDLCLSVKNNAKFETNEKLVEWIRNLIDKGSEFEQENESLPEINKGGTLLSGSEIIKSNERISYLANSMDGDLDVVAVDRESISVASICRTLDIPFAVSKSVAPPRLDKNDISFEAYDDDAVFDCNTSILLIRALLKEYTLCDTACDW